MGLYDALKEIARIVRQADNIELYSQLLDLSEQALNLQSRINDLTQENEELKKKNNLQERLKRHEKLYLTLDDNESIIYCTHCWDNERKLIQMELVNGVYICPHCSYSGTIYNSEDY